jgi:hypothetical protein
MRVAAIIAVFVVLLVAGLVGVVVPSSGQTIPPPTETPLTPIPPPPTPLTPFPTATQYPCNGPGCVGPTATPATPTPDRPPLEPTAEVRPAQPGLPRANYLLFFPVAGGF